MDSQKGSWILSRLPLLQSSLPFAMTRFTFGPSSCVHHLDCNKAVSHEFKCPMICQKDWNWFAVYLRTLHITVDVGQQSNHLPSSCSWASRHSDRWHCVTRSNGTGNVSLRHHTGIPGQPPVAVQLVGVQNCVWSFKTVRGNLPYNFWSFTTSTSKYQPKKRPIVQSSPLFSDGATSWTQPCSKGWRLPPLAPAAFEPKESAVPGMCRMYIKNTCVNIIS